VTFKSVSMIASGVVLGAVITWALVHPSPGESFPVVFRGRTQSVTSDGDGVAFHPNERFTNVFGAAPAFAVSGENRTSAVSAGRCLAPGTAEQDVLFAVVDSGTLSLAWYECLSEGIVRT
jgi:hypothetical protein